MLTKEQISAWLEDASVLDVEDRARLASLALLGLESEERRARFEAAAEADTHVELSVLADSFGTFPDLGLGPDLDLGTEPHEAPCQDERDERVAELESQLDAARKEAAVAWAILGLLSAFRYRGRLERPRKRNRVRCLTCNEVVESFHRHDFRTCGCGSVSVDGGRDYSRVVYRGPYRRVHMDGSEGEPIVGPARSLHEREVKP